MGWVLKYTRGQSHNFCILKYYRNTLIIQSRSFADLQLQIHSNFEQKNTRFHRSTRLSTVKDEFYMFYSTITVTNCKIHLCTFSSIFVLLVVERRGLSSIPDTRGYMNSELRTSEKKTTKNKVGQISCDTWTYIYGYICKLCYCCTMVTIHNYSPCLQYISRLREKAGNFTICTIIGVRLFMQLCEEDSVRYRRIHSSIYMKYRKKRLVCKRK